MNADVAEIGFGLRFLATRAVLAPCACQKADRLTSGEVAGSPRQESAYQGLLGSRRLMPPLVAKAGVATIANTSPTITAAAHPRFARKITHRKSAARLPQGERFRSSESDPQARSALVMSTPSDGPGEQARLRRPLSSLTRPETARNSHPLEWRAASDPSLQSERNARNLQL
jgi:hypothetical protein